MEIVVLGLTFVVQYLSVIVSSGDHELKQRYACVNQTFNSFKTPGKILMCLHLHNFIVINVHSTLLTSLCVLAFITLISLPWLHHQ